MYISRHNISELYLMITEGIEEKIPKLLDLVPMGHNGTFDIENDNDKADFIRWVADYFDPTPNKEYITWLLRMFAKRNIRGEEDSTKVYEALQEFHRIKRLAQFPSQFRDINRYKYFGDLSQMVDQYSDRRSKKESVRVAKEEGITQTGEDGLYKLYIVTSPEAGAKYFRHTEWCVKDPRYFNEYGPPFYFFTKNEMPHALLHLDSNQCTDVHDRETSLTADEQFMMETPKMTDFVIKDDGSPKALGSYLKHVGKGHDNQIKDKLRWHLDNLFSQYSFNNFTLDPEYIISAEDYTVPMYIEYNFSGLEEYFDDKDFQKLVIHSLDYVDKHPDYIDKESFSEDGVSFSYDVSMERSSYTQMSRLEEFLNDLAQLDKDWKKVNERFSEYLTQHLLNYAFISSDWATFNEKVLRHLTPIYFPEADLAQSYDYIRHRNNANDGPYELVFELGFNTLEYTPAGRLYRRFISPLMKNINQFMVHSSNKKLTITYYPYYEERMTFDKYMHDFKIFKSLNTHYNAIQEQVSALRDFIIAGENTLDGFEEIPVLTLRNRKSDKNQRYFQFRENKHKSFTDLYNKINTKR